MGIGTIQGEVYVAGGYLSYGPYASDQLNIYNPETDTWRIGAKLPFPIADCVSTVVGDSLLYLIGGTSYGIDLNTVLIFHPRTNLWSLGTPKPGTPGGGIRGAALASGQLVVAGGYHQETWRTTDEAWLGVINPRVPEQINWSALPPHPAGGLSRLGAGTPGIPGSSLVYFAGGDPTGGGVEVSRSVWVLDVATKLWREDTPKLTGISNISQLVSVQVQDSVFLVASGGFDGSALIAQNEGLLVNPGPSPVLPVEITQFSAALEADLVQLTWKTASEHNNAGFRIEASLDGKSFLPYGWHAAKSSGSSLIPLIYHWKGPFPQSTNSCYFRLVQYDLNDKEQVIGVKFIKRITQELAISITENPINEHSKISISGLNPFESVEIFLVNSVGQKTELFKRIPKNAKLELPIPTTLSQGYYWVQIRVQDKVYIKSILKR